MYKISAKVPPTGTVILMAVALCSKVGYDRDSSTYTKMEAIKEFGKPNWV